MTVRKPSFTKGGFCTVRCIEILRTERGSGKYFPRITIAKSAENKQRARVSRAQRCLQVAICLCKSRKNYSAKERSDEGL
mgnify:CR=1 FL=1